MKDVSIYSEDVFNVSHSDPQQVLKDIRKSNVNKLIFGHNFFVQFKVIRNHSKTSIKQCSNYATFMLSCNKRCIVGINSRKC